jgi:Circularly permutated YpsA SLOG family
VIVKRIISGGQTGVDRAALDWAIAHNVPHGGWCPAGRRAEDGVIPSHYDLQETDSKGYKQRTKWNVRDSDATLIISFHPVLTGGSLFTQKYASEIGKPYLHIYPDSQWNEQIRVFFGTKSIQILNVAGPRGSSAPDIKNFVHGVLDMIRVVSITQD